MRTLSCKLLQSPVLLNTLQRWMSSINGKGEAVQCVVLTWSIISRVCAEERQKRARHSLSGVAGKPATTTPTPRLSISRLIALLRESTVTVAEQAPKYCTDSTLLYSYRKCYCKDMYGALGWRGAQEQRTSFWRERRAWAAPPGCPRCRTRSGPSRATGAGSTACSPPVARSAVGLRHTYAQRTVAQSPIQFASVTPLSLDLQYSCALRIIPMENATLRATGGDWEPEAMVSNHLH